MHPDDLTLNDYVDGALAASEQTAVERHLETCADCRRIVEDFREIRREAAALPPMEPPARAWTRIAAAIEREPQPSSSWLPGRTTLAGRTGPLWLAAAAVLLLATAIGLQVGPWSRRAAPQAGTPTAATGSGTDNRELVQSVELELREAEQHYQKAINGLEQITNAEKGVLDPKTAATLQKNLTVIDQAISESRAALKTQPTSEPAQQSLLESFKTKIALLQDTVALINEMRKGDDAGAARIVSGLKEKGE